MTDVSLSFPIMNILFSALGAAGWAFLAIVFFAFFVYTVKMTYDMMERFGEAPEQNIFKFLASEFWTFVKFVLALGLVAWLSIAFTTYQPRVVTTTTNYQHEQAQKRVRDFNQVEIPPSEIDARRATYDERVKKIRERANELKGEILND